MDLSKRRVLITGASSGIGEATAHAFAKAGAHVILAADHAGNLTRVLDTLLKNPPRFHFIPQHRRVLAYLLCRIGIIPKIRPGDLLVQFCYLTFLCDQVKDAPLTA